MKITIMNKFENQYLDTLANIIGAGVDRPDRTGVGSRAIWGCNIDIDLADGFPIITTRKTSPRIAFEETWFFLRGETDTKKLENKKIGIWKGNTSREFLDGRGLTNLPVGNIGASYSHGWRNFGGFVHVDNKAETPFSTHITCDYSENFHGLVGLEFESTSSGKFVVVKEISGVDRNRRFVVKFVNTGAEYTVKKQNIKTGQIKDTYAPRVYSRGCIGDISVKTPENKLLWQKLHNTWTSMLSRCYNPKDKCYHLYGAKNVYVSTRWLTFSTFFQDVQLLSGWEKKRDNWREYSLDKDFAGRGYYSEKTCRWASNYEQRIWSKPPTHYKGVDQVMDVLHGLKNDPNGRRHIITGWNPQQLHEMALPPCHLYQQYQVLDGKLNSMFLMRSWDFLYGAPFNIMGYALLNHAFAKYLGLTPGKLLAMGCDVHLYANQIEIATQQVERAPFKLPNIEILRPIDSIDDILSLEWSDFKLSGYEAHPDFKDKPGMAV